MKIIGAGFPRTGTMSQKGALTELGFGPCYHMIEVIEQPEQADGWADAFTGKPYDLDALLEGYESTVDAPGCFFWRELLDKHPEAKVLLSVRDPHTWYESMISTVLNPELTQNSPMQDQDRRRMANAMMDRVFGNRRDEDHLTEVFTKHNEQVQREVPASQLLVYEVKQGWEPLCAFLGVDVPDTPFPKVNDRAAFHARIEEMRAQQAAQ